MNKKKTILTKIKEIFTEESMDEVLFVDVKTEDGRILRVSDMEVGATVTEITEDGETEVESGTFELEGGTTMIVEDGKISEINKVDEEASEEEKKEDEEMDIDSANVEADEHKEDEEEEMDGEYLKLEDGTEIHVVTKVEGEISEGDMVHLVVEGEMVNAPEGEHRLEDGRIIVLDENSMLTEIRETLSEEEKEEEMSEVDEDVMKPTDVVDIIQDITGEDLVDEEETTPTKVTGILKDLISQIKELKNSFEEVKKENEELKSRFNKFASEPSEEPIKEKISFSTISREDKLRFFSKR
jgi:hypothetical protein